MNGLHLWSVQLCIVAVIGATYGCIYTHPQQVTGYAGKRLTYICDANCGEKFWKLNDSFVSESTEPYQATIELSGQRSILSVKASAATNNTVVTCFLFDPPNNVESSVNIIVQGTTAKPDDLLFNYNENNVNLSWSQPYILPDTELIEYEVNVSTERNISLFSTTGTNLSFLFTALDLNPCPLNQSVDIFIAGVNEAGVGEPAIVQVLVIQTQTEDCTEAFIPLGAPINVTAIVEGNSVIVSWQPAPFSDVVGYKLMINISTSQDPLTNLMTQTVSTNQTFFIIPLTSFGINKCNGEYSFEVGVTALDLTSREGKTALATVGVACKSTTTENQELQTTFEISDGRTLSDLSTLRIVVGVTVTGVVTTLLAIGVSVAIVLLILRRHRPKIPATPKQKRNPNASMSDNSAYGVNNLMALKINEVYGCEPDNLDPHLYEEIGGKKVF